MKVICQCLRVIFDLYYVINQYLTDADMSRIFSHVFGGTKNKWQQWFSCDMILADRFSEYHVTTIKGFRLILKPSFKANA